jgi:hypothetical protein
MSAQLDPINGGGPVVALPRRSRGYQSDSAKARYQAEIEAFCGRLLEIRSRLDFEVSSRGWSYILEDRAGLGKGDFDAAERLIVECRKAGDLPLNICADDGARAADHVESLDETTPKRRRARSSTAFAGSLDCTRQSASGRTRPTTSRCSSRR